ncbi:unnamed protein product [Rotaria magnacalcarata]|uniref:Tudor domain-containing protein n=2 Tax=Rotaria magnacalcarata TaxID=392030 RepID=A0A816TNJ1_9BILA|nr:unnamed protein product [Rotaria magnacalcarata]CAF3743332.1 unnamed protein product [Rotaria magnacalcarata]
MNDYYSTTDPPSILYKPMEMSCCAARYSVDNRWYCARIKRYSSEIAVELAYLEYGNNEEGHITELRPLDPAFIRLPAQAICTALEDVAETLISLRHGQRASLVEIVRIVGSRLDLNDYAAYNLPKQTKPYTILQKLKSHRTHPVVSRTSNLPSINFNFNDNIGLCTITSITSPFHFFIQQSNEIVLFEH